MIKEILEGKDKPIDADKAFKDAMANMKDINKLIDNAKKSKDSNKLDIIRKSLDTILNVK
ncbi:MAG: hypothetical protein KAI79_13000 [Bacteroidales bacterium]|nr:hypothetical protein [Bacteroidales bacterium]